MALRFLITILLLLLPLAACDRPAPPTPERDRDVVGSPLATVQDQGQPIATPQDAQATMDEGRGAFPPSGDSRVAGQRELLFARLDLDGVGAALRPAEPVIPVEELGFVEAWAFELPDPYVHFSFYLYENEGFVTLHPGRG